MFKLSSFEDFYETLTLIDSAWLVEVTKKREVEANQRKEAAKRQAALRPKAGHRR